MRIQALPKGGGGTVIRAHQAALDEGEGAGVRPAQALAVPSAAADHAKENSTS